MRRKEIDGQEAAIWALAAFLSMALTFTYITQIQFNKTPACIEASELKRGAILIDVERQPTVCKD